MQRHDEALHELLGDRELQLVIETEDFPMTGKGGRLPAFSMCWGAWAEEGSDRMRWQTLLKSVAS